MAPPSRAYQTKHSPARVKQPHPQCQPRKGQSSKTPHTKADRIKGETSLLPPQTHDGKTIFHIFFSCRHIRPNASGDQVGERWRKKNLSKESHRPSFVVSPAKDLNRVRPQRSLFFAPSGPGCGRNPIDGAVMRERVLTTVTEPPPRSPSPCPEMGHKTVIRPARSTGEMFHFHLFIDPWAFHLPPSRRTGRGAG